MPTRELFLVLFSWRGVAAIIIIIKKKNQWYFCCDFLVHGLARIPTEKNMGIDRNDDNNDDGLDCNDALMWYFGVSPFFSLLDAPDHSGPT